MKRPSRRFNVFFLSETDIGICGQLYRIRWKTVYVVFRVVKEYMCPATVRFALRLVVILRLDDFVYDGGTGFRRRGP